MLNKESLNVDFWNAIKVHYDKECYEDALKDACMYLIELIQDKSENYDLDGEKLITNVFSEKSPKLLINKNQTLSEMDEQRGYGFIVRGIICAFRNPLSHDKNKKYSKECVDSVITFINNYLLPKLNVSNEFGYVEDWFKFVFLDNNTDSEKYCNKVLDNISKKGRVDLMKEIVDRLSEIDAEKYSYFIDILYNSLSTKSKNEIIILLNRKLINAKDDYYLYMFFNHFNPLIWKDLDNLVTVRIEEMAFDSILSGKIIKSPITMRDEVCRDALLSTWVEKWVTAFSNYDSIEKLLLSKLFYDDAGKYVLKYFYHIVGTKEFLLKYSDDILKGLKKKKKSFIDLIEDYTFLGDEDVIAIFREAYDKAKKEEKKVN